MLPDSDNAAARIPEGTMTVKTALNTRKDTVEDILRQVERMERDANALRAAKPNLLVRTAKSPATSGDNSIIC